ncbi:MAG: hypothetical protein VKS61_10820 [Candidatus Sericytochromatia bacterium]|nr:hypothetical protein [Candidatus Sericytochromatia bacterium]
MSLPPVARAAASPITRTLAQPAPRPGARFAASVARAPAPNAADGGVKAWALKTLHGWMARHPRFARLVGDVTGPFVKRRFNPLPGKVADVGPAPLRADTVEAARALMAGRFRPAEGKAIIGISGGGKETVHAFVVSGVKPDGSVLITQALAQYSDRPEIYDGPTGWLRKLLDRKLGNQPRQMMGVVEEDWTRYAARAERNSVVLMEVEADPAKLEATLRDLKRLVGRPYDRTMLASDPATAATEAGMYCTEVSSWFVNRLHPGTVKMSEVSGYPAVQVVDHLRATDVHGGRLKVLYNGESRLDVKGLDPFPVDR